MHANDREDIDAVCRRHRPLASASRTPRPATHCATRDRPITLETIDFPDPVIHVAVEPKTKADQEKLGTALQRSREEDPTFRVRTDEETGRRSSPGMGELHLEVLVDRMMREFKVEANVGQAAGRVPRDDHKRVEQGRTRTRSRPVVGPVRPCHQSTIEPNDGEDELPFENKVTGGRIPKEYIRSVDAASRRRIENGVLAGFPMVDVKVTLLDGRTTTSTRRRWRSRSPVAWRSARRPAQAGTLLEPMMAVEVVTPDDYHGRRDGDLNLAAGRCKALSSAANARSSRHSCRSPRCSDTSRPAFDRTQGRASTRCNSTRTARPATRARKRSSRSPRRVSRDP